jgi:limonene-1,2-epoxide hydrolase
MFASAPQHLCTSSEELRAWDATMAAARQSRSLGDRPVVVISATEKIKGMSQEIIDLSRQMHAEVAALSTRGRHVLFEGADHFSVMTERKDAERVAQVVGELLAEVQRPAGASTN